MTFLSESETCSPVTADIITRTQEEVIKLKYSPLSEMKQCHNISLSNSTKAQSSFLFFFKVRDTCLSYCCDNKCLLTYLFIQYIFSLARKIFTLLVIIGCM